MCYINDHATSIYRFHDDVISAIMKISDLISQSGQHYFLNPILDASTSHNKEIVFFCSPVNLRQIWSTYLMLINPRWPPSKLTTSIFYDISGYKPCRIAILVSPQVFMHQESDNHIPSVSDHRYTQQIEISSTAVKKVMTFHIIWSSSY